MGTVRDLGDYRGDARVYRRLGVDVKRLAVLAAVCSFFAFGFSECDPPLRCDNPTVLTGYEDGVAFPGGYRVNVDGWTHTGSYRMSVCSQSDWKSVANVETGVKQVRAYNASERTFTNWSTCGSQPRISSLKKLTNTYGFVLPNDGSWDATTDVFTDGAVCGRPLTEIMVLHRWRDVDFPTPQIRNVTIAGVVYNVYHASGFVQLYQVQQRSSGTFNLLAVLKWCQSKGFLRADATMTFDREGVEILSTYGHDVTFWLNAFAVSAAY